MDYLELDITKKQPLTNRIYLRQGDGGIQKIGIQILKDGQPYSVTDYSLKFEGNLSDGKMVQGNATAEDASQGKFIYTFRNADSSVAGYMRNAYFRLYDTTGNALASRRLLVTVEKNADVTAGQAQDYISGVDDLVNETTEKLADNNQAIANQATQIADLQEALSDVSLHQAWMMGEDGEDFTNKPVRENLLTDTTNQLKEVTFAGNEYGPANHKLNLSDAGLSVGDTVSYSYFADATKSVGSDANAVLFFYSGLNATGTMLRNTERNSLFVAKGTAGFATTYGIIPSRAQSILVPYLRKNNGTATDTIAYSQNKLIRGTLEEIGFWTSNPSQQDIYAYPKYVGFGIKNSDNYQDYKWILNPEWAMANAIYGTTVTTLKQQLNRLQDLTEGK